MCEQWGRVCDYRFRTSWVIRESFTRQTPHGSSSYQAMQLFNKQNTRLFTRELVAAMQRGQISPTPTVVAMHRHSLLRPFRRLSEGMQLLDNWHVIIARFWSDQATCELAIADHVGQYHWQLNYCDRWSLASAPFFRFQARVSRQPHSKYTWKGSGSERYNVGFLFGFPFCFRSFILFFHFLLCHGFSGSSSLLFLFLFNFVKNVHLSWQFEPFGQNHENWGVKNRLIFPRRPTLFFCYKGALYQLYAKYANTSVSFSRSFFIIVVCITVCKVQVQRSTFKHDFQTCHCAAIYDLQVNRLSLTEVNFYNCQIITSTNFGYYTRVEIIQYLLVLRSTSKYLIRCGHCWTIYRSRCQTAHSAI